MTRDRLMLTDYYIDRLRCCLRLRRMPYRAAFYRAEVRRYAAMLREVRA